MSDILGDVGVLIAQYDSRRASAEPASHLRIVGDDEGAHQVDTLDPDRPLATVVSLAERRQVSR